MRAIGIDIGGTNLKAVYGTSAGDVPARVQKPTAPDAEGLVASVRETLEGLTQAHGEADCVGLAAPGLAARDGRSIAWMQGRLEGLQGLDWTKRLGRPVRVLNDAQAATVGEAWIGAAAGQQHVLLLTLGTGVGGGVIVNGDLLRGHIGRAGHLGHISLDVGGELDIVKTPGSLEDLVGDHTVARRTGGRFADTKALVEAANGGDTEGQRHWRATVRALAAGLASLINAFDPATIVLGGGIAAAGDALFVPLREELERVEWRPLGEGVKIVPAKLGPHAGAIGAAWQAMSD